MSEQKDLKVIANQTQDVYERQGTRFDAERTKQLIERRWLERFAKLLPNSATILDAGCGAGEPIAQFFIDRGFQVIGIDYSTTMIELAKARFPDQKWYVCDMRALELGESVNGIIGWHSFFHLGQSDQRAVLARFAAHLKPRGPLMITVGHKQGEAIGHVGGEEVYHASLDPDGYRRTLSDLEVDIIDFVFDDIDCGHANILLAQKR